jgi:EAL domain-containing protein (putative c-di-GMP-specific phosphodiesterase class I)
VETADHVDVLDTLGCDLLQGYFFSPPVPLAQLREIFGLGVVATAS